MPFEEHRLIPTALKNDRCPWSGCDGRDAVLVVGEECPGVACLVEDVVVTVEYGNRELVAAQIFPDVFDWVEFGRVGRQGDEGDVVGNGEILGDVIARTVEDQSGRSAALRTDGAEDVGPFVALVARRARPRSTPSPDAGQRALLADARLVLEPDFNGLIFGMVGEPRDDRRGEVFLNASWASSSVCGWRGRTESRQ